MCLSSDHGVSDIYLDDLFDHITDRVAYKVSIFSFLSNLFFSFPHLEQGDVSVIGLAIKQKQHGFSVRPDTEGFVNIT